MPSIEEVNHRVQSRVWKAIAQSEIDLSALSKEDVEALVSIASNAALMELDGEIDEFLPEESRPVADGSEEQVLWEGRPFLSISTHYMISNQRVRVTSGLLGKQREDIELVRIQDLDQKQTLRERSLNLGDIIIQSHDDSRPKLVLNNVKDPIEVHEILRRAVLEAREKYRLTYREEM